MKVEKSFVHEKSKTKNSEREKVKKLKRVLTKKFHSKSYDHIETIALSKKKNLIVRRASYVGTYFRKDKDNGSEKNQVKEQEFLKKIKEDKKKNVITFIHSNGLIESNMNLNNKKNYENSSNTNGTLNKDDKKREVYLTSKTINEDVNNKTLTTTTKTENSFHINDSNENIENKNSNHSNVSFALSNNQELYQNLEYKSKLSSSHSLILSDTKYCQKNTINQSNNFHKQSSDNKSSNISDLELNNSKSKLPTTTTTTTIPSTPATIESTSTSSSLNSVLLKSPSKASNKPSAPSLHEMYLEEAKDHEKYLLYKNLIKSENNDLATSTIKNTPNSLALPPPLIPQTSNEPHISLPIHESIQYQNPTPLPDPFKPPFTTLSTEMTTSVISASSPNSTINKVHSFPTTNSNSISSLYSDMDKIDGIFELPQPSSLSLYSQPSTDHDSIPPKINERKLNDESLEKTNIKNTLVSRKDSLDLYFDILSQPLKGPIDFSNSSSSNDSLTYSNDSPPSNSIEKDISSNEKIQPRMIIEPSPTSYSVGHSNFQLVMKENLKLRNKLEEKLEETKFQMMIAITQLNLINEQLNILNF